MQQQINTLLPLTNRFWWSAAPPNDEDSVYARLQLSLYTNRTSVLQLKSSLGTKKDNLIELWYNPGCNGSQKIARPNFLWEKETLVWSISKLDLGETSLRFPGIHCSLSSPCSSLWRESFHPTSLLRWKTKRYKMTRASNLYSVYFWPSSSILGLQQSETFLKPTCGTALCRAALTLGVRDKDKR